jgi:hypothetical protein
MDVSKEIEKIKGMDKEEFEAWINGIRSEIWSFPGAYPPNKAEYIGSITRGKTRYFYYIDSEGNMYYESDSGYLFKKEMAKIHIELIKKGTA